MSRLEYTGSSTSLPNVRRTFALVILSCLWSSIFDHRVPHGINGLSIDARSISTNFENELSQIKRDSSLDVCVRWSQQSAIVNGTLYLYGGQASTQSAQSSDTWSTRNWTLYIAIADTTDR